MKKHNPKNERVKHNYRRFLKEAKQHSEAVFQQKAWGLEQTHYPVKHGYSGSKKWVLQRSPDLTMLADSRRMDWPWSETVTPDGAFTYVKIPEIYIDEIKSLTGSIIMEVNNTIINEGVDGGNLGSMNAGDEVIKYAGPADRFFAGMEEFVKPIGDRLLDVDAAFPDIYYRPEESGGAVDAELSQFPEDIGTSAIDTEESRGTDDRGSLDISPTNLNIDSVDQTFDLFGDTEVQNDELRDNDQRDDTRTSIGGGVQGDGGGRGAGQDPGGISGTNRPGTDTSGDGREAIQPGFDWTAPSPATGANGSVSSRNNPARNPDRSARIVPTNYRITDSDQLGFGGPVEKARGNLEAIRIVKSLKAENRKATADEQAQLVKYVGWVDSQLANNIFPSKRDPTGSWAEIHDELKELLTETEYNTARRSTRYTSKSAYKGAIRPTLRRC